MTTRRWYEKIVADDVIKTGKDTNDIIVHETTIEKVQEHYYRYSEFLEDIEEINNYMKSKELGKMFDIKHFDWEGENNA